MRIRRVEVQNFRLLKDVSVLLEDRTTLVVGRNNSGKTSLTELFRRLLTDRNPTFALEDFSLGRHEAFWTALERLRAGEGLDAVREALPVIEVRLTFDYDQDEEDFGALSDCIIDLDPDCCEAKVIVRFAPTDGAVGILLAGFESAGEDADADRVEFFRQLKDRIRAGYTTTLEAVDPNDETNRKSLEPAMLSTLVHSGFINAQRGLDDVTHRDRDVLGKVLEVLFTSALSEGADGEQKETAEQLKAAVQQIERDLETNFNSKLTHLLPAFSLFGYPGLNDPGLVTETSLDVTRLLSNHTRVRYKGVNGFTLPETYNGLGARNLVFILLQLLSFFRAFKARSKACGVHLIFIEEPEAHLHPQMQEVFIRKIEEIAAVFEGELNGGEAWPVQFVVSTHSPHMANEARFEALRYFLSVPDDDCPPMRKAQIKDLREGMGGTPAEDRNFLHQYLTLTRCDLFFADKAVLIEGTSERLLLPRMIEKIDAEHPDGPKLASQYLTVMEVGGAYAHRFFPLLEFLDLRTLVITDIDAVKGVQKKGKTVYQTCLVAEGERTSNACLTAWFDQGPISPAELIAKAAEDKIRERRRIAYQIPEAEGGPCGRSFEDAFILANAAKFPLDETQDAAEAAREAAAEKKKSAFALTYAIDETDWTTPKYIAEGLRWLANEPPPPSQVDVEIVSLPDNTVQVEVTPVE
ncbi:MAG TPA: ATP-dependent endonuclease [Caulobacteraceae bacterium]|nr:ATP-dependent endonuclease [Caulobacteraceae bacterium]